MFRDSRAISRRESQRVARRPHNRFWYANKLVWKIASGSDRLHAGAESDNRWHPSGRSKQRIIARVIVTIVAAVHRPPRMIL